MQQIDQIEADNADGLIKVFKYVTFDRYEDGVVRDKEKIFQEVLSFKGKEPVIDFDSQDLTDKECKINVENKIGGGSRKWQY